MENLNKNTNNIEEYDESLNVEKYYIKDMNHLLSKGIHKYSLFVKRNDRVVINYDDLEKFMNMKNIEIEISFSIGAQISAFGIYKPDELMVHVGGSLLTAEKKHKEIDGEGILTYTDNKLNIKSDDWKLFNFVHVVIHKKSLTIRGVYYETASDE